MNLTEGWLKEHIWPRFSRVLASTQGIYLANHSLGRPLDQTALDVQEGLDLWYSRLDGAWEDDGWPAEINRFRSNVAKLIDAPSGKNVIPKTSAGQGLRAVLNAFDGVPRVLATRGEFDSVDLILKAYAAKGRAEVSWIEPTVSSAANQPPTEFESCTVFDAIERGGDLLVISYVFFSTGQVMPDLEEIVARAKAKGILVIVDAYHAAGVLPFSFTDLGADFMIGGSYKYARGGPGACWLALDERCRNEMQTLDTGWFAKQDPFAYERPDPPEFGEAWLESTPPVLTMYQARAGLELLLELGVDRLREHNLHQQRVLMDAFRLNKIRFIEKELDHQGAFVLVPDDDPFGLARLLAEANVIVDARWGTVRFGPDILNTDDELREAAKRMAYALLSRPKGSV